MQLRQAVYIRFVDVVVRRDADSGRRLAAEKRGTVRRFLDLRGRTESCTAVTKRRVTMVRDEAGRGKRERLLWRT